MRKNIALIVLVCMVISFFAAPVFAAQGENKVVRFFKNVFNWPFSVTKKGAEATGRTLKQPITTTTTTASSAIDTVTGKPEKIKDVVVEPVKGTAETAKTAVEGYVVKTPVEGTTDAFKK